MIYADINDIFEYYGISENLNTAIDFIQNEDFGALKEGRNELDSEKVFINRFNYETVDESEQSFEAHRHYLDVHIILDGHEKVGISEVSKLKTLSYDDENDSAELVGDTEQYINLRPGKVLVLFPEEAHKVKLISGEKCNVEKAVIKVKIN